LQIKEPKVRGSSTRAFFGYRVVKSKATEHVVDNQKELLEKDRVSLKKELHFHTKQCKTRAKQHDDARNTFLKTKGVVESTSKRTWASGDGLTREQWASGQRRRR
jgi:hypothetical protein